MRRILLVLVLLGLVGAVAFWFMTRPQVIAATELPAHTPNLENGKVMFYAGGCIACHATPKAEDHTRLGGGLELKSPYGSFYPPNISPHPKDGIGSWNEAQFVTAMLKGTSPDGRHYFPSFPYASYQKMTLADLRDMFAFIKTLPQVEGRVRDHDISFPFNIRLALGGWKFLYLDGRRFTPDPNQPAQWNRGAYLVNGPGHCAECHSPRNAARRHRRREAVRRRTQSGRRGDDPEHHPARAQGLFRQGHPGDPDHRHKSRRRQCRRLDGGGGAQHLAAAAVRPRGDGGLYQVAAAGAVRECHECAAALQRPSVWP